MSHETRRQSDQEFLLTMRCIQPVLSDEVLHALTGHRALDPRNVRTFQVAPLYTGLTQRDPLAEPGSEAPSTSWLRKELGRLTEENQWLIGQVERLETELAGAAKKIEFLRTKLPLLRTKAADGRRSTS